MKRRILMPALLVPLALAACGGPGGGGTDSQNPTVSLSVSSGTVTSAGTLTLSASASDNVGVTKVEFYDGSSKVGEDTTSPYSLDVALTAAQNGAHSYTAKAYDAAGNTATSAAQSVTVNISASLPAGVWDSSNWDAANFQ